MTGPRLPRSVTRMFDIGRCVADGLRPGYTQRPFVFGARVTRQRYGHNLRAPEWVGGSVVSGSDDEDVAARSKLIGDVEENDSDEALDLALERIVASMKRSFSVDEALVLMLDGDDVVTVGTWSRRSTALWTGARLHLSANSLEPMLARTNNVFSGEAMIDGFLPILDRVLAAEGSRCWVSCPLLDGALVVGALVLASAVPGSLCPSEELYFRSVASLFEGELIQLGRRSLRQLASTGAGGGPG
jgi:hypothetical protein